MAAPKNDEERERIYRTAIELFRARAVSLADDSDDTLEVFCLMGLLHFSQLLNDEDMRALSEDIVESRALTSSIVCAERFWAAERLPERKGTVTAADALTVSLGGAYELIYQGGQSGRKPTPGYVERAAIVPFALTMGFDRERTEETIERCERKLRLSS